MPTESSGRETARRPEAPSELWIWAVDPFVSAKFHEAPARTLHFLQRRGATRICPVYVFNPKPTGTFPNSRTYDNMEHLPLANQAMTEVLHRFRFKKLEEPQILVNYSQSIRSNVEALISFAREQSASGIVVSSHARAGASRLFMGSFAETLVVRSPLPVLVVNPGVVLGSGFKKILFPTCFEEQALPVFQKVVRWAVRLGGRITMFHQQVAFSGEAPDTDALIHAGDKWAPLASSVDLGLSLQIQKKADPWLMLAQKNGVACDLLIDRSERSLQDAVLATAESGRFSLIAIPAKKGPLEALLIGSKTRAILRKSSCPVWVLHQEPRRRAAARVQRAA